MSYSQEDLATLSALLLADVPTYGALSDQAAADVLNTLSEADVKPFISGGDMFSVTDAGEFDLLTDAERSEWLSLCAIDNVNPANGTPAAAVTIRIFGGGSVTTTSLIALRSITVSPASVAGLPFVREDHVRIARTL